MVSRAVYQLNGPCAALRFQPLMLVSVRIRHEFRKTFMKVDFYSDGVVVVVVVFVVIASSATCRIR